MACNCRDMGWRQIWGQSSGRLVLAAVSWQESFDSNKFNDVGEAGAFLAL